MYLPRRQHLFGKSWFFGLFQLACKDCCEPRSYRRYLGIDEFGLVFHSNDSGAAFEQIDGVSQAFAIALGALANDGDYPAVYVAANLDGFGYFLSTDALPTWNELGPNQ
ncbi:hypothetical protein VKT23_008247 [Stygiomarasmius scandens]|uniref:Uncharacterized protein n=1 Tax=Marasmiellus scandens TaxID=2682957 RepID=A0ABR1JIK3_9AGAR